MIKITVLKHQGHVTVVALDRVAGYGGRIRYEGVPTEREITEMKTECYISLRQFIEGGA